MTSAQVIARMAVITEEITARLGWIQHVALWRFSDGEVWLTISVGDGRQRESKRFSLAMLESYRAEAVDVIVGAFELRAGQPAKKGEE